MYSHLEQESEDNFTVPLIYHPLKSKDKSIHAPGDKSMHEPDAETEREIIVGSLAEKLADFQTAAKT